MTDTSAPPVSRNCATGQHAKCLGTVYQHPPVDGVAVVPCACTKRGCTHGKPS